MDETLRTRLTGEAKFLRAYFYSYLYNLYGRLPIVEKPLGLDELKVPRATNEETLNFILKDLDDAIAVLPVTQSDIGRATKGAAIAWKAKMLLYAGQWAEAAATAKQVMDLGKYSLFYDNSNPGWSYKALFNRANENNSEVIFDAQFKSPQTQTWWPTVILPSSLGGWTGTVCVCQNLADAFECTDGKPITESPLYNPANPFQHRDPRLDMSIVHDSTVLYGTLINTHSGQDSPYKTGSVTGYYCRKYADDDYVPGSGPFDENMIYIRYAEVLLIYAEAKIEANSIDQSVLDAINSIRARAYGVQQGDVSSYPAITTMDQSKLRAAVRNERQVELCFEDARLYDIRRWKTAEVVMNTPAYGGYFKDGTTWATFLVHSRKFETKMYLWPIPQTEIDLIGKDIFEQNPGW